MGMVRSAVRRAEDQERAPGLGSGSGRMLEVSLRVPPWSNSEGRQLGCCWQPLPVRPKVLRDALPVLGAGQVEAALAACLRAADGSSPLATDKAVLERAEQPPLAVGSGPRRPAPLLRAGRRVWAPLPHTLHSCLADEARLLWWDFVPEPVGRAAVAFFGSREAGASLCRHQAPRSVQLLTFWPASWSVRWMALMGKPKICPAGHLHSRSPLAKTCRREKSGIS